MTAAPSPTRIALGPRSDRAPHDFDLRPEAESRETIAAELHLSGLKKLRFSGRLVPEGRSDWRLEAELGATMVQPCGVTLDPVTTRVDEPVLRRYLASQRDVEQAAEQEMPEETEVEALPATLDLEAVMLEALALAVPAFPRADGAQVGSVTATAPGAEPIRDADLKPFAGLKDAMKREE